MMFKKKNILLKIIERYFDKFYQGLKDLFNKVVLQIVRLEASMVVNAAMLLFAIQAALFGTLAIAFSISKIANSYLLGFGLMGLFYLITSLAILLRRNRMKAIFINMLLRRLIVKFGSDSR